MNSRVAREIGAIEDGFVVGRWSRLLSGNGGRTRARTWDPLIKSQLLYQLSYAPDVIGALPEEARL